MHCFCCAGYSFCFVSFSSSVCHVVVFPFFFFFTASAQEIKVCFLSRHFIHISSCMKLHIVELQLSFVFFSRLPRLSMEVLRRTPLKRFLKLNFVIDSA